VLLNKIIKYITFSLIIAMSASTQAKHVDKEVLLNGWYLWDPYQYLMKDPSSGDVLTGLDIELTRAIAAHADMDVTYQPVEWKQHQQDLKDGKRDFASGATKTPEREEYAYFSKPYRYEEDSLFIRRGEESTFQFKDVKEFLAEVTKNKLRVGVIDGYQYADPAINAWLEDPKNDPLITRVPDDKKNVRLLLADDIDVFLADRIAGSTQIWRLNKGNDINEVRLGIQTPIHFMFSKAAVPYTVVEKFNKAIDKIQNTSQYQHLISWYLHPVLLLQTIDTSWFIFIEILGTIAFAISGLVMAVRDKSTLFGAFIFAVLPSLGGGIIRDVIFERRPIGALESPEFLMIVVATVLIGFFSVRFFRFLNRYFNLNLIKEGGTRAAHIILMLCDGLGLAAFTVTGIVVSVMAKANPLWLWGAFFAFLTGAGGGILRDALSKQRDFVSLRGDIYPEIAVVWGTVLSVFLMTQSQTVDPEPIRNMVFVTVVGAFLTRVLVYYFDVPNIYFSRKADNVAKP
jgi:polar amino acid transport system substrate-binding protein